MADVITTTGAPFDPFAQGGRADPVAVLWDERETLLHRAAGVRGAAEDELMIQVCLIENAIMEAEATSPSGLILQIRTFSEYAADFEWDNRCNGALLNMVACLQKLEARA